MNKRFVSGHNFSCAEKILSTWALAPAAACSWVNAFKENFRVNFLRLSSFFSDTIIAPTIHTIREGINFRGHPQLASTRIAFKVERWAFKVGEIASEVGENRAEVGEFDLEVGEKQGKVGDNSITGAQKDCCCVAAM